jgi:hypothetical protein
MRIAHLDGDPFLSLTIPTREAICAVCEKPIMWCLDMMSFTIDHPHRLAHARCVWTKSAFRKQERLALEHPPAPASSSQLEREKN